MVRQVSQMNEIVSQEGISGIIARVREGLGKELPGRPAQFRMAPSFRMTHQPNECTREAGVMILLYPRNSQPAIAYTKRHDYVGIHGGQVSFPGGKKEPVDSSLIQTATRETREELGLATGVEIVVLGALTPLYIPVSDYLVYPFAGYIDHRPRFDVQESEVHHLVEVDLSSLLDPSVVHTKPVLVQDQHGTVPYYEVDGEHIWGATAMITSEFLEVISQVLATR